MDLIKHALYKPFMVWKLNFNYSRKRMKNKCKMLLFDIVLAPKDKEDEITKSGPFAPFWWSAGKWWGREYANVSAFEIVSRHAQSLMSVMLMGVWDSYIHTS